MVKLTVRKLKASTVLEVIIAMVIILVVFVLATHIYINVISSSPSLSRQAMLGISEAIARDAINQNNFINEDIQQDSLEIHKVVTPYKNYPDLYQINIVISAHGKMMGDYNYITQKNGE